MYLAASHTEEANQGARSSVARASCTCVVLALLRRLSIPDEILDLLSMHSPGKRTTYALRTWYVLAKLTAVFQGRFLYYEKPQWLTEPHRHWLHRRGFIGRQMIPP